MARRVSTLSHDLHGRVSSKKEPEEAFPDDRDRVERVEKKGRRWITYDDRHLGLKGGEADLHLASLHCCLLSTIHCSTLTSSRSTCGSLVYSGLSVIRETIVTQVET